MTNINAKLLCIATAERNISNRIRRATVADRQAREALEHARVLVESNHRQFVALDAALKAELERLRSKRESLLATVDDWAAY